MTEPSSNAAAPIGLPDPPAQRRMPGAMRVVQIVVTLLAFAFLFANVDKRELARAFARVGLGAWLSAGVLTLLALGCGLLRWHCLLRAFGAERPPSWPRLFEHYAAGYFYNTYLPGGITGDVVRSVATRDAFAPGSAGSYATVFMERALGLLALLTLSTLGAITHPLPGLGHTWLPAALGCLGVLAAAWMLFNARRIARFLPRAIAKLLERLPEASRTAPLMAAGALSFTTQFLPALSGHILVSAIVPGVRLADSLVIVPLAAAAAFVPISVSGAGVREGIFVVLYGLVGVPRQAALAASISMWFVQAVLAAFAGAYTLLRAAPRQGRAS
jgi:uncharacterized membrane protein YbhN (UPF0104 family)